MQSDVLDEEKRLVSALDLFFVEEDGSRFKVSLPYQPYIYVQAKTDTDKEVVAFLSKKLAGRLAGIDMMDKEDLDLVCTVFCVCAHACVCNVALCCLGHVCLAVGQPLGGHTWQVPPVEVPLRR